MEKKFESKLVGATIERETEKAVLLNVEIEFQHKRSAKSMWFPKSQLKMDESGIYATAWIITEKRAQVIDELPLPAASAFVGFVTDYVKA